MPSIKLTAKKIGMLSTMLTIFVALGTNAAFASDVTRSFSTTTPVASSTLTVSLAVNVTAPDNSPPNDFYIIDEVLPAGWTVSNPGTGDISQVGHIKWAVLSGATSTINQYTVVVPSSATGTNIFSGQFAFGSNLTLLNILGANSVTIFTPPPVVTPPPAPTPVLTSITVTPSVASTTVGGTQQFSTNILDQNGTAFSGATVTWSSSDTTVATVDINGVATSVGAGTATITASAVSGTTTVTGTATINVNAIVTPPPVVTPPPAPTPILTSVTVTPATISLPKNTTQQLTANPLDQNNVAFTGATVSWSSSNTALATVDTTGLVTIAKVISGKILPATLTITANAVSGTTTASGTAIITITSPVLTSVVVTPATTTLDVNGTQVLTASPFDQNGLAFPGTTSTWTSSNKNVASVDTTGLVTAVAPGIATITATVTDGVTTVIGTSVITVNTPTPAPVASPILTSVTITPPTASITTGATQQLTANPLDQNNAVFVGSTITWSSNNPTVATVDGATGLVTGVSAGGATITATAISGTTSVSGTATINVNAIVTPPPVVTPPPAPTPVLTSITVTPSVASTTVGGTQQFSTNILDQNGTAFSGATVTWSSSDTTVATVDINGVATSVGAGTATITASAVSGTTTVTGTATINVHAIVTPPPVIIPPLSTSTTLGVENRRVKILSVNTGNTEVDVPNTITDGSLDMSSMLNGSSATLPGSIRIHSTTPDGDVDVDLSANTTLTSSGLWNGIMNLPTSTTTSVDPTPTSGNKASKIAVIEIGNGDTPMTFNNPVKITFAGQAGKLIGWTRAGSFHEISATCDSTSTPTLSAGADCKVDSGLDLIVWTKHFTTFVTYTETPIQTPSSTSNTVTNNSSVGGGGGGGYVSLSLGGGGYSYTPTSTTIATTTKPSVSNKTNISTSSPSIATNTTTVSIPKGKVLGASTFNFTKNLHMGSHNNSVMELQKFLVKVGLLKTDSTTGYFGKLTKKAVKKWQVMNNLPSTGIIGKLSREKLNETMNENITVNNNVKSTGKQS